VYRKTLRQMNILYVIWGFIVLSGSISNCALVLAEKETRRDGRYNPHIVENFVNNFGKNSLQTLSQKLSQLSVADETQVVRRLNDNQMFLVRLSYLADDTKISVAACLFNGNRSLAQKYCDLPIDLVLHNYVPVEQAMVHYDTLLARRPSIKLEREAFKLYCLHLGAPERSLMVSNMQNGFVDKADILKVFDTLGKLRSVSSSYHHKDLGVITWFMRIKPSFFVRLMITGCFCTKIIACLAGSFLFMQVATCAQPIFERVLSYMPSTIILPPLCLEKNEVMQLATIVMQVAWGFSIAFCALGIKDQFTDFKQRMTKMYKKEPTLLEFVLNPPKRAWSLNAIFE